MVALLEGLYYSWMLFLAVWGNAKTSGKAAGLGTRDEKRLVDGSSADRDAKLGVRSR